MLDEAREASKHSRKLGRVMGIVAAHRLKKMRQFLAYQELATWRRTNGFDRVVEGEESCFHGHRSLPPTPQEYHASLRHELQKLKNAISMPNEEFVRRPVASPVAHQNKSGVSSSSRIRNAVAGISEKKYHVPWETGKESELMSSGNAEMAAALLSPGGVFINKQKNKKVVDINHFHVSLAHAHSSVLEATAQQHGIQLVGELALCSRCSMTNGIRAPTPHHTTSRAAAPMDMVHIDTVGPFQESLGGSRYVVMFVDGASRFQRPYGARDNSASAILGVVKRFVADMGVP